MKAWRRAPMPARLAALALVGTAALPPAQAAPIVAVDDAGRTVRLDAPARRVVTLAPSLTELVYAAGGGAALVGADTTSDFPPAARALPRVGDATRLDVERLAALKPDLVLVWQHGNNLREVEQIEALGLRTFRIEPRRLDDVPSSIERVGALLGTEGEAARAGAVLRERLSALRRSHVGAAPVRVFYQVWPSPLMTINGSQLVSDAIELCGGRNVFASLPPIVPQVSAEAVLAADPQAILSADERGAKVLVRRDAAAPAFAQWTRHPRLAATRAGAFYLLDGDAISRQGPRIVDGAAAVCEALDEVRRGLAARR